MRSFINRIVYAFQLFWFGLYRYELFGTTLFKSLSDIFMFILKSSEENKPFITHLMMGGNKIVSLWAYPGVSKNPIDRIQELNQEIDELKLKLNTIIKDKEKS